MEETVQHQENLTDNGEVTLKMTAEMADFLTGLLEDDLKRTLSWAQRAKSRTTQRAKRYESMSIKALLTALVN